MKSLRITLLFEIVMFVAAYLGVWLNNNVGYLNRDWLDSTLLIIPAVFGILLFLTDAKKIYTVIGSGGKIAQHTSLVYASLLVLIVIYLILDPTMWIEAEDLCLSIITFGILPFTCWLSSKLWLFQIRLAGIGALVFWSCQTCLALANIQMSGSGIGLWGGWTY